MCSEKMKTKYVAYRKESLWQSVCSDAITFTMQFLAIALSVLVDSVVWQIFNAVLFIAWLMGYIHTSAKDKMTILKTKEDVAVWAMAIIDSIEEEEKSDVRKD